MLIDQFTTRPGIQFVEEQPPLFQTRRLLCRVGDNDNIPNIIYDIHECQMCLFVEFLDGFVICYGDIINGHMFCFFLWICVGPKWQ